MCCHPGYVVASIKHRLSRFSIILKGPGIFRMVNEYWFQPEVTAALVPHRRVNLSFEAAGVSNLQPTDHLQPRVAMNVAQHNIINLLKTL